MEDPCNCNICTTAVGGILADLLRLKTSLTRTTIRKLLAGLGFGLKGLFFIWMGYTEGSKEGTICLSLSLGFSGLAVAGYAVNVIDLTPRFAGLIMGFANSVSTFTGILSTVIASFILKKFENKRQGWLLAFYLAATTQFAAAIIYVLFASCEEQHWSMQTDFDEQNDFEQVDRTCQTQSGRLKITSTGRQLPKSKSIIDEETNGRFPRSSAELDHDPNRKLERRYRPAQKSAHLH